MYNSEDVKTECLDKELHNLNNSKDPNVKMKTIN